MITEDKKNKFISTALINKRCITTVRALTKVRISICIEGSILYRVLWLPIGILVIMTMIMVMMDMSIMPLSCPDIHVFLKKKFFFFHHSGCVFYQTFLFYLSFQILVHLHHYAFQIHHLQEYHLQEYHLLHSFPGHPPSTQHPFHFLPLRLLSYALSQHLRPRLNMPKRRKQ